MNAILRAQTWVIVIAVCTVAACTGTSRSKTSETREYKEVLLADVVKAPRDFDGSFVRVRGLSGLYFESTVISVLPQKRGEKPEGSRWIWLDVGWPLDARLMAMNREEVTVDARFVATRMGNGGFGTLIDIRAIWLPGRESQAFVLNHETRIDALEQLRFRTGWIWLGTHIRNGHRRGNGRDNGWVQTWFSFSSPPTRPDDNCAPKNGDQIEITERSRIFLLDYANKGEERRLEQPIALSESNSTRLWLAPGARVELADVRANWADDLADVNARVVPVASK